jgi:inner membrane protein
MEPVTHILTGACLARAGFNRRAAYATMTMVVAAEFPDIDTLWGLRGPIEGFQHHRGITHTFLGLPFEAALIVAAVYEWHQWRVRRSRFQSEESIPPSNDKAVARTGYPASERVVKPLTTAPVRWGVLYGLALLALLSHLLLDYTNNYGLRPFFPFNDRWYAASIVFIFDPVMFVLLLGALVAPWLFGLVGSEVGARKQPFRARGWAIAALLGVVGWWMLREVEHEHAVQLAMVQSIAAPVEGVASTPRSEVSDPGGQDSLPGSRGAGHLGTGSDASVAAETVPTYLSAQRVLANPDPLSPFRWSVVTDFGPLYQLSEIDTRNRSLTTDETTYPKPGRSATVLAAEESKLGRVYMDWSPMPIVNVTKPDSELVAATDGKPGAVDKVVTFRDPRFMGGWMREAGRSALVGTVTVDAAGHVVRETMDGQVERDDR